MLEPSNMFMAYDLICSPDPGYNTSYKRHSYMAEQGMDWIFYLDVGPNYKPAR
jgi:hypothetical protein